MKSNPCIPVLIAFCTLCIFTSPALVAAADDPETVNVDELPHKTGTLPNGTKYTTITYLGRPWRIVDPSVLSGDEMADGEVCFEGKLEKTTAPDKIKLLGIQGTVIVDDAPLFKRLSSSFKINDNVWFAGELRRSRDGKSVEMMVVHALKQPKDLEKFEQRFAALQKANDYERLIELGHQIEQQRNSPSMDNSFDFFEKMGTLRNKAFETGLDLKEKSLRADDADGLFALALQWREILRRNHKFRELVERVLKIDPEHPRATKFAEELGLEKYEKVWLRKDEVARLKKEKSQEIERQNAEQKSAAEARQRELEKAIAERPQLLTQAQASLRVADAKARRAAIAALGEAIARNPDAGFGREAAEILINLSDPSAVTPGLEQAVKSELPDVRKAVFEGLVWRGSQDQQGAFDVLAAALKNEKDAATAQSGVDSLVALGGRPAAATLVACLGASDTGVRDEVMEGLKLVTKQPINSKEGWQDWWNRNKDSFNPQ